MLLAELKLCLHDCQSICGQHQEDVQEGFRHLWHACHTHQPACTQSHSTHTTLNTTLLPLPATASLFHGRLISCRAALIVEYSAASSRSASSPHTPTVPARGACAFPVCFAYLTVPSCSRSPSALWISPAECSEVKVVATFREGALYKLPTVKSKSAANSRSIRPVARSRTPCGVFA